MKVPLPDPKLPFHGLKKLFDDSPYWEEVTKVPPKDHSSWSLSIVTQVWTRVKPNGRVYKSKGYNNLYIGFTIFRSELVIDGKLFLVFDYKTACSLIPGPTAELIHIYSESTKDTLLTVKIDQLKDGELVDFFS